MSKNNQEIEPPAHLLNKIMGRIEQEERLLALKRRIFGFFISLTGLIVFFFYSLRVVIETFTSTGFSKYFSLIFTDTAIVINYWQSFFATLLESFPAAETAIFLVIILGLLQLFKTILKDLKKYKKIQNIYGFK
ncbi:MAG: hypothetical protein WC427_02495 [Candidatus Paceibacterota bacterium]